ncbi:MAG: hypothetical protein IT445_09750 [Phycisphaeraceae bacterium]|nr:hypothetical protein [Phycisphaeraceae bacterium]
MPTKSVKQFQNTIRALESTRDRVERIFTRNVLARRDIDSLYEGLFLRAVVAFESLLECRFFEIARGQVTGGRYNLKCKMNVTSDSALREIVFNGRPYVDWLPFKYTEERARRFLTRGHPFTLLDDGDRAALSQIVQIRNVIAHKSAHAKSEFKNKVIGAATILNYEKTPAGYLRSIFRTSPDTRRIQMYLSALAAAAVKLDP